MKEGSLSGPSPPAAAWDSPGSGGEEHDAKQAEPKGLGPKLAIEWRGLKSELEGWGEGAFASLLLA